MPDRKIPGDLDAHYRATCDRPSDINEHLPRLFELASKCEHVTEMGMRGANGSTVALLAAQPAQFVSWDINPMAVVSQEVANLVAMNAFGGGRTFFQPRVGDTLQITIEETDLLFIDTLHTARQLKAELERHGGVVRKYLAFHDTHTFGEVGEDGGMGLRAAIRWFQKEHMFPLWQLIDDRRNNNGLAVLERAYPWPENRR